MQTPDTTAIGAGLLDGFGTLTLVQRGLLETAAIMAVLTAARWAVLFVMRRRTDDVRTRYYWRKAVTYTISILGLLLIGRVWLPGVGSIATFLGLLGAGIAVALKDALQNLAGWLFILWRRPFAVGDRIQIGDDAGDVIDLRIFQFTLLEIGNWVDADQSTGRVVHVPNGKVFSQSTANYTRGFPYIWNEIAVLVTFESDWQAAKQILHAIAARHAEHNSALAEKQILEASRRFMIFYSTLKPTVYTSVKDSGILLTIRYLCEAGHRRGTTEAIWEDVLREFALRDDVDFAYPTLRYYDNAREGRPGTLPGLEPV
jgi:small-conductance mechanosensitive channel